MHDRFLNRESRQEDLDLIQDLRESLSEKEDLLRKLQVENNLLSHTIKLFFVKE